MNDNVRKIFDMLGVEPNEKFKLKEKGDALYCLTGNLTGYVFDERGEDYESIVEWLLREALINPEDIIKLPKKKKKKKFRDLTEEEYKKWINKNCNNTPCDSCNFNNVACNMGIRSWIHHKDLYSDKFLDQEIEVEE
mgnify:CR=1 FL=1